MSQSRQLAAIMFTDIVGYTALMGNDEQKAFTILNKNRALQKPIIEQFNGHWVKELGDGVMASFPTVSDAVNAAMKIQEACNNSSDFQLRIGIHQGEVVFENDDVFGDGVNIAARIQAAGVPGSILFSKKVNDEIRNKPEFKTVSLGNYNLKNVNEPVEVFALANEGLKVPQRKAMTGKLIETKKRARARIIIGVVTIVLFLVVTGILYEKYDGKNETIPGEITIAVLPFKNISINKEENEPFCEGIVSELQKKLEWIGGLTPIAPQSMEKYRDTKLSVAEISNELGGVKYIVQGNVQRDKNKVKVYASLIDAKSEKPIWSDDYPGDMEDVFSLQENIAEQIAFELKVKITPEEKIRIARVATKNAKALDAYNEALSEYVRLIYAFRSIYDINLLSNEQLYRQYLKALSLCSHIFDLDSSMAEAYALKANILFYKYEVRAGVNYPGLLDSIESLGRKALSLDENSVDAYIILAKSFNQLGRASSSLQMLEKGLAISPNNFVLNWEMGRYYIMRDPEKCIRFLKKILRLDPLSVWTPMVYNDLAMVYLNVCDFDKAEMFCKKTLGLSNNSFATAKALQWLEVSYLRKRMADSVIKYSDKSIEISDVNANYFKAEAYCYLKNDCAKAVQLYKEVWINNPTHNNGHRYAIALWKSGQNPLLAKLLFDSAFMWYKRNLPLTYDLAGMYAFTGDKENAYRILNQFKEPDWFLGNPYLVPKDPLFDKIRNEKEFNDLIQKVFDDKKKLREKIRKMEEEGKL